MDSFQAPFDRIRTSLMNQPTNAKVYDGFVDCLVRGTINTHSMNVWAWFYFFGIAHPKTFMFVFSGQDRSIRRSIESVAWIRSNLGSICTHGNTSINYYWDSLRHSWIQEHLMEKRPTGHTMWIDCNFKLPECNRECVSSLSATITIFHPFHQPSSSSSLRRLCAFHETIYYWVLQNISTNHSEKESNVGRNLFSHWAQAIGIATCSLLRVCINGILSWFTTMNIHLTNLQLPITVVSWAGNLTTWTA